MFGTEPSIQISVMGGGGRHDRSQRLAAAASDRQPKTLRSMAAALTCGVCGKGPGGAEGPAGTAAAGGSDLLSCVSCLAA